ncbi:hypothetical protein A7S32_24095 [Salmonella enterica subsp. diarizonae serovar 59:[k]:z35]|uniref:Uncharacterized protein n=2 Tax=Salmonella enterica TaxID=28901 RepID=A0A7Z1PD02_SALET|nr:hypothetical protein A7S32_24095 [Salmonella enterica subsp. diarizonae serovar 59:[k]:z35]PTU34173.1 hypothetical protein DBZ43_25425 [Salmonella enterica subsp. enterica]
MSHFTVLVIGNNPEQALAPYHEFECTGIDDRYIREMDITEEVRGDVKEQGSVEESVIYNLGDDSIVSDESEVDLADQHKFGYAIIRNGELIKAVRRTNPNAKWDWYCLGGRWDGFFLHKNGMLTNSLRKGDIDLAGMLSDKAIEAKRDYEKFAVAVSGHEFPRTWTSVRTEIKDIDKAREFYKSQPAIKSIKEAGINLLFECAVEHYGDDEQAYVIRQVNCVLSPYAIIHEGNWIAKGEMGWFGLSEDEVTQDQWNEKVSELISKLQDETMLSLYDCHI